MRRIFRLLTMAERGLSALAALALAAIMLVVVADVAMRYAFRAPITGVAELVGLYLMVLIIFFSLSRAWAQDAHIRVDLFLPMMSPGLRRLCEIIGCLLGAPVFLLIARASAASGLEAFRNGEVLAGLIAWPTWIPPALVAAGSLLLALRLLLTALAHALSLIRGQAYIALPQVTGHEGNGA